MGDYADEIADRIAEKLALFPIIQTLFELIATRAETEADPEMDEEDRGATLDAIERSIGEYFSRLDDKVDGIAYVDRELETRADVDKREGQRLLARAARWERAQKDFRNRIAQALKATGQTRIDGAHNTLRIQANPASVDVRQPELVPSEYKRVIVKTDLATWNELINRLGVTRNPLAQKLYLALTDAWTLDPTLEHGVMKTQALPVLKVQGPCDVCRGAGKIAIDVDGDSPTLEYATCEACRGTGKVYVGAVAGLALVTDQVHLRIK